MCCFSNLPKVISADKALTLLPEISRILLSGGVIAVPTDTIYGFACSSLSSTGIDRICEIKGRDMSKPLAVCLDKPSSIPQWSNAQGIDQKLFSALLPGPVTVLLPRLNDDPLNPLLNPNVKEIGIRVPDCPLVCRISEALAIASRLNFTNGDDIHEKKRDDLSSAIPLVLTSANPSGCSSTLSPEEFSNLWPKLDLVINGGRIHEADDPSISRTGSTVVDLSPTVRSNCQKLHYRILRDGSALEQTEKTLHAFGYCRQPMG
nr:yrdc domain containing protein mitochondrial [Hymenolepis microstoma]